jgi:hypothetical protein
MVASNQHSAGSGQKMCRNFLYKILPLLTRGLFDVDVNAVENKAIGEIRLPLNYWRLWLLNAGLVSAGMLFFLAAQYGTYEFFGMACLMALLPLIPLLVLVGGAGSTIFALTKVMIEKRSLKKPAAWALLAGPGIIVCILFALVGASKSPDHRLAYICFGNAPVSATHVRVAGYSRFLREEWLAVFNVEPKDFQTMVAKTKLVPVDDFEFRKMLEQSSLKGSNELQSMPHSSDLRCFKRNFKPGEEHERGSIYAAFDPATSTGVAFREYRD